MWIGWRGRLCVSFVNGIIASRFNGRRRGKLTHDGSKLVQLLLELGHTSQLQVEFVFERVDLLLDGEERQC